VSLVTDIADAVVAELNAAPPGTFSQAFTAVRRVRPEFDLQDLETLQVSVVPKQHTMRAITRGATLHEPVVTIGVQKRIESDEDAETAALGVLTDEIARHLRQRPLAAMPGAVWAGTEIEPVYAPEHLAEHRVFTSVVTVNYQWME